jgi:hypothetical protein
MKRSVSLLALILAVPVFAQQPKDPHFQYLRNEMYLQL